MAVGRGISLLWVYPRVCGGTFLAVVDDDTAEGLSPRVRGNPFHPHPELPPVRSIPACAGEPVGDGAVDSVGQVYPRVCGGTSALSSIADKVLGLSPRVRGNHIACLTGEYFARSIPACAGEPTGSAVGARSGRVYPRVCGGTEVMAGGHRRAEGLSPRVRGNQETSIQQSQWAGSIPACAGEPCPSTGSVPH